MRVKEARFSRPWPVLIKAGLCILIFRDTRHISAAQKNLDLDCLLKDPAWLLQSHFDCEINKAHKASKLA